jgi:hypothetical protein
MFRLCPIFFEMRFEKNDSVAFRLWHASDRAILFWRNRERISSAVENRQTTERPTHGLRYSASYAEGVVLRHKCLAGIAQPEEFCFAAFML